MDKKKKKLKIGIYNPYFDSLGGGERYVLTLAEHWSKTHDVSIFWDDKTIIKKAIDRFGLDVRTVQVVPNIFGSRRLVRKLIESSFYDLIFFLSDGSVPTTLARHNILHFQVPFSHVPMTPWKAARYQSIVVNSAFTKNNLDKSIAIPVSVIYPPVGLDGFETKAKTKTIVSVGRFNALYSAKKQDVLIKAFKEMQKDKEMAGWKLILAGGCLPTDIAYVESLKQMAKGHDIEFLVNCSYEELKKLYSHASIYWHAAGFGETDPKNMEHFGITTVEAMASGCIPVVYNGGGQPEIVTHKKTGYVWNTIKELKRATYEAMKPTSANKKIIEEAKKEVLRFSKETFNKQYDLLLQSVCK